MAHETRRFAVDADERSTHRLLAELLEGTAAADGFVIGPAGEHVSLPASLREALTALTEQFALGLDVHVSSSQAAFTPSEVGALLGEPLDTIIESIKTGALTSVDGAEGTYIPLAAVLAYARQQRRQRREALLAITRLGEEFGQDGQEWEQARAAIADAAR